MNPLNALPFFLFSLTITASVIAIESPPRLSTCHPEQRDALSRFNRSFSISGLDLGDFCTGPSYPKTASWREDEDCCSWEGVTCDNSTGDIVGLDLSCARLLGNIDPSSSMFSLPHLRSLSLAGNDLTGVIPTEISQLSKLVSLNLSYNILLEMQNPTMRMLVRNLTQLEELDLTSVDMSTVIPTSLMNFSSSLISLNLVQCSLQGKFPDYIFQLPNIQTLVLSENTLLNGTLPGFNWSSTLAYLSLSHCSFSGEVPHSIGNLPRLTYLDISGNNFTGHVDLFTFSTLKNLQFLWLSGLIVSGEDATEANPKFPKLEELRIWEGNLSKFPCFLFSMPKLRELSIIWSNASEFPGQCVNNGLSFPLLERVIMDSCELTKFPSFLSQSNKLRYLDLKGNMIEEIPSWFWGVGVDSLEELYLGDNLLRGGLRLPWKRLDILMLQNNSFEGPLPIPTSRSISEFWLSWNRFNGSIPPSICHLTSLVSLHIARNNLTGVVPRCLGNLTYLKTLDLRSNSLTGPLPILTSPSIQEFLGTFNHFNGSIPPSICHLTSLVSLELGQNNLTGVVPLCLGNLTDLWSLDLSSNSLTGPLPPSLANCTSMDILDVSSNFLGRLPGDIFLPSTSVSSIDLSNNRFEGPLPLPSPTTLEYSVSNNNFSGEISSLICNANNLWLLDLSNNGISGTLPHCLKNITTSLVDLNLRVNKFHGSIPEIFAEGCALISLDFSGNQFAGSLPRSLSNCQSLEVLDAGRNNIADSFPNWLGDLPLKVLSLRSNKFHGQVSISQRTRLFSGLRILDLSNNGFEGNLSDNFISEMFGMMQEDGGNATGYMTANRSFEYYSVMIDLKGVETEMVKIYIDFTTLDMSSNHFWGDIPRNIGLLKSLKSLNFSHNSFMGTIPLSLENLTNLESLDLSSNHLFGEIPKELVKLTALGALNLSWNNLTGPIPSGGHFNTFSDSFEGNTGLCGIPLTRVCGQGRAEAQTLPDQRDKGKDELGGWFEWTFVAMGFGSGVGIGISLGYMVLEIGRPLWLARMVIRLEDSCRKRSKRKAPRRNSWT